MKEKKLEGMRGNFEWVGVIWDEDVMHCSKVLVTVKCCCFVY